MASEITNLLPFRQYDDNDVVNMFAYDGTTVGAGLVVKVSAANLNDDLIDLVEDGAFLNTQGNAYSPLAVNPLRVAAAGSGDAALGILLRDVRDTDENGEKLRFYPQKKEELQCVLSGESVPVATKGIFTISASAFQGSLGGDLAIGSGVKASTAGTVTGCAPTDSACFGTIIGTGSRDQANSNGIADQFSGEYLVFKFN